MEDSSMKGTSALKISTIAIMTAVVAVFTFAIRVPVAPTRGYLNLGDVAIYFSALTFGPITALICGGLGTALADIIGGYAQWAPISLVVHGLQGLTIGLLAHRGGRLAWVLAAAAGTALMCAGYFIAGSILVGPGAALVELPGNVLQNVAGVLVGLPLSLAVRRAYPPVEGLGW
jgi:uncharacterized membrane protein